MKIAIDVRNIGRHKTGSEIVVQELVRHLLQLDRKNEYILLTDTDDAEVHAQIREKLALVDKKNVSVVSLNARNKFMWAAWSVWRWARAVRPDVFHTEYIVPFFLPRSVRILTHIHDVSFAALPHYISWKDRFFLYILIPWSLCRADCIIAISEFTRAEILRYYHVPAEKVVCVYNAVPSHFETKASKRNITHVRKKYHLPKHFIFSLGTMQPRKNIPFLVAAFAQYADRLPHVNLVLSGRKGYHFDKAISATIAQYPQLAERIIFTGFIDAADLPAVYAAADLFVFPSLYEGFGLPLLEAMSQGTLVLANDLVVFREIAGDAALYADAQNLDTFANAIYTMIMCDELCRDRFVRAGMARVAQFSWVRAATALHTILEKNNL